MEVLGHSKVSVTMNTHTQATIGRTDQRNLRQARATP
jgi:hypothetical protein